MSGMPRLGFSSRSVLCQSPRVRGEIGGCSPQHSGGQLRPSARVSLLPLNARRREETPASMAQRGGALKAVYPRRRVNRRATTNRRFIVSALIETLPIHWLVFVVVRSAPAVGPYDGGAAGVSCGLCE